MARSARPENAGFSADQPCLPPHAEPAVGLRASSVALLFVPMAAIGTQLHELGHAAAALLLGHTVELHYGSMTHWPEGREASVVEDALVTAAGPVSTVVIGCVGLVWLARLRRTAARGAPLGTRGWTALLLALFWSRQVFNAVLLAARRVRGEWGSSDEVRLAGVLGWPPWSLALVTALAGLAVCAWVVLRAAPPAARRPLLTGGVGGALLGYVAWYGVLGPLLLP